jgi:hypothetical protein
VAKHKPNKAQVRKVTAAMNQHFGTTEPTRRRKVKKPAPRMMVPPPGGAMIGGEGEE